MIRTLWIQVEWDVVDAWEHEDGNAKALLRHVVDPNRTIAYAGEPKDGTCALDHEEITLLFEDPMVPGSHSVTVWDSPHNGELYFTLGLTPAVQPSKGDTLRIHHVSITLD